MIVYNIRIILIIIVLIVFYNFSIALVRNMYHNEILSVNEEDVEDETRKQIRNAINIDIVALPPPVDALSDNEDIDDTQIQQYAEKLPTKTAGEIELQWEHRDGYVKKEPMQIPYEDIEVKYEEICDAKANLPTSSANVNESPFEFTAPIAPKIANEIEIAMRTNRWLCQEGTNGDSIRRN